MTILYSAKIKACLITYFVILFLFLYHVLFFADIQDYFNAARNAAANDYTDNWMLESGERVDIDDISSKGFKEGVTVSKVLPENMEETDSICFSTSNLKFDVYVDDKLIYSYDTKENFTGNGDGIAYHMIGLGAKDEGAIIRIEGASVFSDKHGGRLNNMKYGREENFRYFLMRNNLVGVVLSFLMTIFGVVVAVFYFGMHRKNAIIGSAWALGLSAILFGLYSICDTGIPQLLTGTTYASRELVYGILNLAGMPLVFFLYSVTKSKRRIFFYLSFLITVLSLGGLTFCRYALGIDLHQVSALLYTSYGLHLAIFLVMLIDNEIYCRRKKISSNLLYFYIGTGIFIAAASIDMIRYSIDKKGSVGHGSWLRFGLVFFLLFVAFQIFDWWSREKSSLERDRFVNRLLQYIMDAMDTEEKINKVLEYMCEELDADRAYIFEDMRDGTFDNTYEYCAMGVTPQIDNLKGLPYDGVVDVWYQQYMSGGHVLIYDIEKYREVSMNMYNVLKPQGIETLVTGPLILEGEYIGFFGVDNPPPARMEEISEIIGLLTYFLSELVARRDNQRRLVEYSYQDFLTGVGNRRAIKQFEIKNLDTSRPYGFIMCDINGLKSVNDNEGHDAGDELIKNVANCLISIFGKSNIFRMGGDEFAVYAFEDTAQILQDKIDSFKKMIDEKGYHVAVGYSYAEEGDPDYRTRKTEADNRMYDAKREFYRNGNDRRRRGTD